MKLHIEELTGNILAKGVVDKDICKMASYRLPRRKVMKRTYLFYTCLPMPVTLCPAHNFQPSHLTYHCPLCASSSNKHEYFGGIFTHACNSQKSYAISPSLLITYKFWFSNSPISQSTLLFGFGAVLQFNFYFNSILNTCRRSSYV